MLVLVPTGQGDFDLADALDDSQPTKKPGSGLYPKLPDAPQPGRPDSGANIYPRLKPQPHPQPGNSDTSGGHSNDEDDGHQPSKPRPPTDGDDAASYDGSSGSPVARIVSPIVSVVVVALVGAGVTYFKSSRRAACLRDTGDAEAA
ncbi:glycoprotein Xg isoform X2 [Castor canadensis]|uniref:Glycoprotein Xg isoform X2 n=1 Tax=Castor canadensis TaxID=51338 RepID=A0AC58LRY9_CASCN